MHCIPNPLSFLGPSETLLAWVAAHADDVMWDLDHVIFGLMVWILLRFFLRVCRYGQ